MSSLPTCNLTFLQLPIDDEQRPPPPSARTPTSISTRRSRPSSSISKLTSRPSSCVSSTSTSSKKTSRNPQTTRRFQFSHSLSRPTSATTTRQWRSPSLQLEAWLAEQLATKRPGNNSSCPIRRSIFRNLGILIAEHISGGLSDLLLQVLDELNIPTVNSFTKDTDQHLLRSIDQLNLELQEKEGEIQHLKSQIASMEQKLEKGVENVDQQLQTEKLHVRVPSL
ncbi:hypothetical protein P9112_004590 [Eukaryota sp. TZLM1-RC]